MSNPKFYKMRRAIRCFSQLLIRPAGWSLLTLLWVLPGPGHAQVQGVTITGRVSSEGESLPGVNVFLKGTTVGTVTDAAGNYSISVPEANGTLVFSFIGYSTQEAPINGRTTIDVLLSEDIRSLDEVVVVGYTTQKKSDISGSIAIVDVERASTGYSQQIGKQLQGRAAGVTVISSGQPGETPTVRIRGINTFGNNDPLYIVDGVPTQNVNDLSPADIESMQVLKDASAASIYGSRASNGVIVITTRKGKGAIKVDYNASAGWEVPREDNVWDMLNPLEMAQLKWLAIENSGGNPRPDPLYGDGAEPRLPDYIRPVGAMEGEVDESTYYVIPEYTGGAAQLSTFNQIVRANKQGTDWYDEIVRPAFTTNHTLSVSGGGEMGNFYVSFNHLDQEGIVIETFNKRSTFRVNSQFNVNDKIRIGQNLTFSMNQNPTIGSGQTSPIGMSFSQQPIIPVYDIAGNYAGPAGIGSGNNPVAQMHRTRNDRSHTNRLFGNAYAEVDLLQNLTLRTSFGGEVTSGRSHSFTYPEYENSENNVNSSFSSTSSYRQNWVWTNTLTYKKNFASVHDLSVFIGTEAYKNESGSVGGETRDYFSFDPDYVNLSTGSGSKTNFSSKSIDALFSVFGRLDYSYKNKYIVSATLRRDGSSRFIGDYRWGTFPAGSVAWRISQESFMQDLAWLDDLRIRAGYGIVGNQLNVSTDNPHTQFVGNQSNSYYAIDGSNSQTQLGFRQARIGNPEARWEKNISGNIGIDALMFKNRLEFMVEYYVKDIEDLLYTVSLPGTMGMASVPSVNVGHVRNRGVDASLGTQGTITGDLAYDANVTFTAYRNEIVYIADGIDFFGGNTNRNEVGHPMNSFYGYTIQGYWQTQQEIDEANASAGGTYQNAAAVGRYRFTDTNNDGLISSDDQTMLGSPHPDFTVGIDLGLRYKNFDLNIFLYGSQGNEIWSAYKRYLDFYPFLEGGKSHNALYNSWTPENRDALLPIQENSQNFSASGANTDYYVEEASYLRIQQIILGYALPASITERIGASRLRFYAQVSNPLILTGYSGLDPQVPGGVDTANYSSNPQYQLGLNLSF
jgi:TonB-linked SusC/RagA family outer membrane protein